MTPLSEVFFLEYEQRLLIPMRVNSFNLCELSFLNRCIIQAFFVCLFVCLFYVLCLGFERDCQM